MDFDLVQVTADADICKTESHYRSVWDNVPTCLKLLSGPMRLVDDSFRIAEFPPTEVRKMWTYASIGMADLRQSAPIELHLFAPVQDRSLVELLTAVAYYHTTVAGISLHHTVNFGRPWREGATCSHGFVSLPYLDGPRLENLQAGDDPVKCFWLIPITDAELAFKRQHGVESLENSFDRSPFDYLDARRNSVV